MKKQMQYSTTNLQEVYDLLEKLQKQSSSQEYEIRVDDVPVIHRSNDLSKFFQFKSVMTAHTHDVSIRFYQGNSRRYHLYQLLRNSNISPDPNLTAQEYIDQQVANIYDTQLKEAELSKLQQKVKSQNKMIRHLQKELKSSQKQNNQGIQSLIQSVAAFATPSTSATNKEDLKYEEMLLHYEEKFGEPVLKDALGVGLKLAENEDLLELVKTFIHQKSQKDDSNTKR